MSTQDIAWDARIRCILRSDTNAMAGAQWICEAGSRMAREAIDSHE